MKWRQPVSSHCMNGVLPYIGCQITIHMLRAFLNKTFPSFQPLYGLIEAKLELITHAYFDERDFSKVEILRQIYNNLSDCLSESDLHGSQVFLGNIIWLWFYSQLI